MRPDEGIYRCLLTIWDDARHVRASEGAENGSDDGCLESRTPKIFLETG
jgi:hypothetical protein